jgi:LysW-gamma-L-alpha-aminoadipyl-6-phosphate/LysW-L-glutamyl-5-phosphate reductase
VTCASVAVLGASGYAGGELVRLLLDHPGVELRHLSSRHHAGRCLGAALPGLRGHPLSRRLGFGQLEELPEVDVAFCCLPNGVLPGLLGHVRSRARLVISLAGDYRLRDGAALARHYPESLRHDWPADTEYVVPELAPAVPARGVLSVPGCMAVAAIYALHPLWSAGLVEPAIVVDAKTGASGAGQRSGEESAAERMGNVRPHRLHGHRHQPEIAQTLTGIPAPRLRFASHSLDVSRGVLVTAYTELRPGSTELDVRRAYVAAYRQAPFVRVLLGGNSGHDRTGLKSVLGSNAAELAFSVDDGSCVTVVSLDNLLKGAGGQAVQIMNTALNLPQDLGLPRTAIWP